MTPPRWRDEHGKLMATRPCARCGTLTPVERTFRLEHLKMIGWPLFAIADYASWCGHRQEFLLETHIDGVNGHLVPILREAA